MDPVLAGKSSAGAQNKQGRRWVGLGAGSDRAWKDLGLACGLRAHSRNKLLCMQGPHLSM